MDPNVTLNEIRLLVTRNFYTANGLDTEQVDLLAGLVEALDEWITNGGLLPNPWKEV